jgi:hypothetical protein
MGVLKYFIFISEPWKSRAKKFITKSDQQKIVEKLYPKRQSLQTVSDRHSLFNAVLGYLSQRCSHDIFIALITGSIH